MKKAIKQSTFTNVLTIISIVLLFLAFTSTTLSSSIRDTLSEQLEIKNELYIYSNQLKNASVYLTSEVRAYSATGLKSHYDNYWNEVNNLKNRDTAIAKMKDLGMTESEVNIINSIMNTSNNLIPLEEKAMEQVELGYLDKAIEIVYGSEYEVGVQKVQDMTNEFIDTLNNRVQSKIEETSLITNTTKSISFLFLILVAVMQLSIIIYIRKNLLKPIFTIQAEMTEIANGNLSNSFALEPDTSEIGMLIDSIHKTKNFLKSAIDDISSCLLKISKGEFDFNISYEYIGEFKQIKKSFEDIIDELNDTFKVIAQASNQVEQNSEQVAKANSILSEGSANQADGIIKISDSVENINKQINQNSANAENASKNANEVQSYIYKSDTEIKNIVMSMKEIDEKSQKINDIIKIIENIAFQTNILALNAAIEAQRAGEAGQGFSVVADEVRKLAAQSTSQVKNTTQLIESITDSIKTGNQVAKEASNTLEQIITNAKQTTQIMNNVSKSAVEQANTVSEIALQIENISDVIQNNSELCQESAASSQDLNSQTLILQKLISKFKLKA